MAQTRRWLVWMPLWALLVLAAPAAQPRADTLVVDLSDHLVAITAGFTGTEVLLFGAVEGHGDVIVTVRGPEEELTVRRKDRKAGIWVNSDSAAFTKVPSYYATATNRPLDEFTSPQLRARYQIGVENLDLRLKDPGRETKETKAFRSALIRGKQREQLYSPIPATVTFLGNQLFRTDLVFPANVPTGTYQVGVYLVNEGHVVSAEITPLIVSKTGISADIFYFANRYAALYGIVAILVAVGAGWLAGLVFRKS